MSLIDSKWLKDNNYHLFHYEPMGNGKEGVVEVDADAIPTTWIPCSERMPKDRELVFICYREWMLFSKKYSYTIVIGWYARKFSVKEEVFSEWEDECDYNADDDTSYVPEGWYEFTTQGNGDIMSWGINAEVVAWMPLPDAYKE